MSNHLQWTQDILGPRWVAHTIALGNDDEGPLEATLVRAAEGPKHKRAVLYLHGFVDFFEQLGYDFYALDLRKYGRSLRPGQSQNYVADLADYRAELDHSARIIAGENHRELVVLGHSTGGLIASLWVNARTNAHPSADTTQELDIQITALILNSPWFDLNKPWFLRTVGTKAVAQLAKVAPKTPVGKLGPHYGTALHSSTGGSWNYDLAFKPLEGFPVRAAWFAAVRRGHQRIKDGLDINVPVLVLTSDRSGDAEKFHEELLTTDSVLNVQHIWEGAANIADHATIVPVAGGAHDLALSPDPARTAYFDSIRTWLAGLE
jgi:alpha-beta hydrolase superfamily lysophospholipase